MVAEIELFESTNKKAWLIVFKKEKLLTVNLNFNVCLNGKFVTQK
jgi:hypothetical protein